MRITEYFVYILACENGAYYIGYTNDLKRRYEEHLKGSAKCKFTRSFKPLFMAQSWKIGESKSLAMKVEHRLKKLSKAEKEQLIAIPESLVDVLKGVKGKIGLTSKKAD